MHGMHTVYFIKDLNDLLWVLVSVFVAAGCAHAAHGLSQGWGRVGRSSQIPVSQLQPHLGAQQSSHLSPALDGGML